MNKTSTYTVKHILFISISMCALWGGAVFSQTTDTENLPPAIQEDSPTSADQDAVIERGISKFPGLQRRPMAPPSGGTGQSPSSSFPAPVDQVRLVVPLAQHPQGQQMMAAALKNASLLDINFTFLNKTYEKDVYGPRDPISGKRIRLSCVRLKATSGFNMRVDVPQFNLNPQGLTVSQNISRLSANGIKIKWQLGPCMEHAGGFGLSLSDVKFVYKARPTLTFDEKGFCRLSWNQDPDQFRVAIGGMNITGVQNDLDKLAKDAVREGVNWTLDGVYGSLMRNELTKITVDMCGNKMKIGNK